MKNSLPTITTKQQEILTLIYRYRFLNRTQIQTILGHKDKRRIISWLKDLREKEYVDWHYDATDFIAKSQPGIYYLSLNGIRYLRELGGYPSEELRKRYKEPIRTQPFINRCLLIADCCVTLQFEGYDELQYGYALPSDYADSGSSYHFLDELKPHLFFTKQQNEETVNYLLESIEPTLPRYQLRKRVKDYLEYMASGWDNRNGPAPIALFICPSVADLLHVKRLVKKLLEENWSEEEPYVRVATLEKVRVSGVSSMIWEEV